MKIQINMNDILNSPNLCRICISEKENHLLRDIFDQNILEKFKKCLNLRVIK